MGNITEWSGFGYVEATRKVQDRNGEPQELLAATHCI